MSVHVRWRRRKDPLKIQFSHRLGCNLLVCSVSSVLMAQVDWIVPDTDVQKISPFVFDEEMVSSGEVIYENSCIACHGTPTQNNPVVFVPSPGDPASEKFQDQSDGSLYYKIGVLTPTTSNLNLIMEMRCWPI